MDIDASDPPHTPSAKTIGVVLLQCLLQYFCQGAFARIQRSTPYRADHDTIYLRSFVALLVISSSLQTAMSTYKTWIMAIENRHWWSSKLYNTDFLVNGLTSTFCELYLIRRCWKFSGKNLWLLCALTSLAFVGLFANIWLNVRTSKFVGSVPHSNDASPLRASLWAFPCWVYVSLALDLATTSILSISLWRSRTGVKQLDTTVRDIIGITWESAALPCILMIISTGLYFSSRNVSSSAAAWALSSVRHLDLFFILSTSKFYVLGLLRTLNSRVKFREKFIRHEGVGRQSLGTWLSNEETVVDETEVSSWFGTSRGSLTPDLYHQTD
ncbi:hypothetical protein K474DRAFT_1589065 [Panus rudis PR-1116 ss-1]|nr:hypothetical protein K474DRAFT_1589065 [Panus rudis PR-1116 ss-1]